MDAQTAITQRLNSLTPIYCSNTGKQVVAERQQQFDIPSGQVIWLQCEACQGWHIMLKNTESQKEDIAGGGLQQML